MLTGLTPLHFNPDIHAVRKDRELKNAERERASVFLRGAGSEGTSVREYELFREA